MWIKNAQVLDDTFKFKEKDILIKGELISEISDRKDNSSNPIQEDSQITDLTGLKLLPGLIDVHIHGCGGASASKGGEEALETMSRYLATRGVTSFLATSSSGPVKGVFELLERVTTQAKSVSGARVAGVHLEGPFFNEKFKGAHEPEYLLKPDKVLFNEWIAAGAGMIKIISLAPEISGAGEVIKMAIENKVCVSGGHTAADYDEMCLAIDAGVSHATHLFNAMPQLDRRNPGAAAAFLQKDAVACEIIGDFHHVHPVMVELAWRMKKGRLMLISDAMEAAGLADGEYDFYGIKKTVKNGLSYTEKGVISGSTSTVLDCVKNLVSLDVSLEEAVRAATILPAQQSGISDTTGSITEGKFADLVAVDDNLTPHYCWVGGKLVYRKRG